MSNVKETSLKYNLHSWSPQKGLDPAVIVKAEGIFFYDEDGKKYYDMSSQLVNSNLGHGNRAIIDAIKDQVEKLAFIAPSYAVDVRSQAAKTLVEFAGKGFEGGKVFFTNAGTESNENAIKFCKSYTGKWKFLSMYKSYHGSTFASSQLTGEARRFISEPGVPGFYHFEGPYPYRAPKQVNFKDEADITSYYLDRLEEAIKRENPDAIAGIFMETVVGSNGLLVPPKGYLKGVRALCDKYNICMVCDEVMAGFYRTGSKFAFQQFDVVPDMVSFAKGSTCGYVPLGGVIVQKKIADFFNENKMWNGLTYSAHPVGCAAAIAAIGEYERLGIADNVKARGAELEAYLKDLYAKHKVIGEYRTIGIFAMIELVKDRSTKEPFDPAQTAKALGMLKEKGFATYLNENCIAVSPPLIISATELKEAMAIMDSVLVEVDKFI
jgi:taurine--2-oxoglutarate transaminase